MVTICAGVNERHDGLVVSECVYWGPLVLEAW